MPQAPTNWQQFGPGGLRLPTCFHGAMKPWLGWKIAPCTAQVLLGAMFHFWPLIAAMTSKECFNCAKCHSRSGHEIRTMQWCCPWALTAQLSNCNSSSMNHGTPKPTASHIHSTSNFNIYMNVQMKFGSPKLIVLLHNISFSDGWGEHNLIKNASLWGC